MLSEEVKLVGLLRIRIEIARNKVRDGREHSLVLRVRRDAQVRDCVSGAMRDLSHSSQSQSDSCSTRLAEAEQTSP